EVIEMPWQCFDVARLDVVRRGERGYEQAHRRGQQPGGARRRRRRAHTRIRSGACSGILPVDDLAADHGHDHPGLADRVRWYREDVLRQYNQIGELAGLKTADLIVEVGRVGRTRGVSGHRLLYSQLLFGGVYGV